MFVEQDRTTQPRARWYAVKCQPHRESLAERHLINQGFSVFLPRNQRVRRHARKVDIVLSSFFPSYLFVRLDVTRDRWRCVNSTWGVCYLVMQGSEPAPVPAGVIEELQARCDNRGVVGLGNELKPGQSVRILTGALADFVGELEKQDAHDRVRVLLTILGKPAAIVLPRTSVVPERLSA